MKRLLILFLYHQGKSLRIEAGEIAASYDSIYLSGLMSQKGRGEGRLNGDYRPRGHCRKQNHFEVHCKVLLTVR